LYRAVPRLPPDSIDRVRAAATIVPARASQAALQGGLAGAHPITTWTVPQPHSGNNDHQAKPPPHRRIVSDPDQRSQQVISTVWRCRSMRAVIDGRRIWTWAA